MINFNYDRIIEYCGQTSFERGRKCASSNSFTKVFIQDNAMFGLYQGTVGVYRVNIIFGKSSPDYAWCTCPAMLDYDGKCKHIAAMLILWNRSSHEFKVLEPLRTLLENKSKEDLLKLIIPLMQKSIDSVSALYEILESEPLFDYEDFYEY